MINLSEPKISVIIPLYNAEKYIRECLISVLASKFQDYEVLVVDDCSTDSSVAEVEKFLPHFGGRLKILSTEKNSGGPGLPRNIGIKNASGKYITFIDNDDMILPTALGNFFETAEFYNADFVNAELMFFCKANFDGKNLLLKKQGTDKTFVDAPTFRPFDLNDRMRHFMYENFYCFPWGKFFRRDFLIENKIDFPQMMQYGEDFIFFFKCLCFAKKYLLVPYATNIHRVGIVSAGNERCSSAQEAFQLIFKILFKKLVILDEFMNKLEFFKDNPNYRYEIFKFSLEGDFEIARNSFRDYPIHLLQKLFFDELQNSFECPGIS